MTSAFRSFRAVAWAFFLLAGCFGKSLAQEPPLYTAAEVISLAPDEARSSREVRLRGVVTFTWHTGTTEFTIEDQTGAVWFPAIALPSNCRVGTEVEIEGRTDAGLFGPFVHAKSVKPLGTISLPAPQRCTYDELLAAPLQGRRVEITGIVRGQRVNPELGLDWLALDVATGGGRITVNVTHEITGHPELIDALVRIRGVNLHGTDAQQQAFLPMINAHTLADIEVLAPANPRPFDQAATSLAELMRSASVAGAGHRVRARGVVTFMGRDSFYLQDESRGIQVFLREAHRPVRGEVIDVVGFPEPGAFSPILRDADWRPTEDRRAMPAPHAVTLVEAAKHDGCLVAVEGRVTDIASGDRRVVFTLEGEGQSCRVRLLSANSGDWTEDSIVRVIGVCSVEIGNWETFVAHRRPTGFALLVQEPDSITLIRAAPWWNPTRVAWAIATAAGFLCCALAFVWWRTKVRLREAARTREAARAQFAAVLGERNRIAREIHDTLAQSFAGISAQLEVLNDRLQNIPAALRRHLDLARDLARSSLDEARRSVWNLRAQALEESTLCEALRRLGEQLVASGEATFELKIDGTPHPLPAEVENNLLKIGQEAIANAVRHADATRIIVSVAYRDGTVSIVVSDDGKGFDPAAVCSSTRGGFGLAGIRERAEAIHASLTIDANSTGGTRVELCVPHV